MIHSPDQIVSSQQPRARIVAIACLRSQVHALGLWRSAVALLFAAFCLVGTATSTARASPLPPEPAALPQDPAGPPRLNQKPETVQPIAPPENPAVRKQPLAINLAPIADWSPQAPFLDHFKTARPWIGHLAGRWGGAGHADLERAGYLDPDGWPTGIPPELGSIGTMVLTDLPAQASSLAGRYALQYSGDGIIEVSGRAQNIRYAPGDIRFDFTPGPGAVEIRIQRTDRQATGDYIRHVSLVQEQHLSAFQSGQLFNPVWLERMRGFAVLRFMGWMATNNSDQTGWEDRPQVTTYSWALKGVPAEILLDLTRELNVDPWFTLPHMANDTYFRRFARLAARRLPPARKAYIEYSNEVWNAEFSQAHWAGQQARLRWGDEGLGLQFYGGRAAEMAQIWEQEFGTVAATRLVRVIATQSSRPELAEQILTAPHWTKVQPDGRTPASYFDAYATAAEFGKELGQESAAPMLRDWLSQSAAEAGNDRGRRFDRATALATAELTDGRLSGRRAGTLSSLLRDILPAHDAIAQTHGIDLILYTAGSRMRAFGPPADNKDLTAFFTHLSYTPEMGALYAQLLNGWASLGGRLFTAGTDIATPTYWGSQGALRYLGDVNPRWEALEAAQQ